VTCPGDLKSLLAIGAALLAGGAFFLFAKRARGRRLEKLRALEAPLGGRAEGNMLEMWFSCSAGGMPAAIRFVLGDENEDSRIKYEAERPTPYRLRAGLRRTLGGAGAYLAGLREVPSGDPGWDSRRAVYSDDPVQALRFAGDREARAALDEALGLGFETFSAGKGKVLLEKAYRDEAAELEPARVRRLLGLLAALAGRL
jgi:hypothetical protein